MKHMNRYWIRLTSYAFFLHILYLKIYSFLNFTLQICCGEVLFFGQSCDLSGLNKIAGEQLRHGIRVAFNEINKHGDLPNNTTVQLITLDDG